MKNFKVGDKVRLISHCPVSSTLPIGTLAVYLGNGEFEMESGVIQYNYNGQCFEKIGGTLKLFKIGDELQCLRTAKIQWLTVGKTYKVVGFNDSGNPITDADNTGVVDMAYASWLFKGKRIVCIKNRLVEEEVMSKYSELKERIEGLNDGWNKDADDILKEIYDITNVHFAIKIGIGHNANIYLYKDVYQVTQFRYISQCQKNSAFKKAVLYILDNSSIKDDKEPIRKEIAELRKKLEELERKL